MAGRAEGYEAMGRSRFKRTRVRQDAGDWQETAPAVRSSDLLVLMLAALGLLVTASLDHGLTVFQVWCLLTALAVGYMLSRGLAKAGVPWRADTTMTEYRRASSDASSAPPIPPEEPDAKGDEAALDAPVSAGGPGQGKQPPAARERGKMRSTRPRPPRRVDPREVAQSVHRAGPLGRIHQRCRPCRPRPLARTP